MVGGTLGHYRIVRSVGTGGMGEVYAAEDLTLGRTVAIKVLPSGLHASVEELERLAREAKSVAALNHPPSSRSIRSSKPTALISSRWSWSTDSRVGAGLPTSQLTGEGFRSDATASDPLTPQWRDR
jgi:serine/threonine protein kinase